MLEHIQLAKVLFLDVETAAQVYHFEDLDESAKKLWETKFSYSDDSPAELYKKAGIFAEFAKVICVTVGFITPEHKLRLKSFFGHDEKELLKEFSGLLNKSYGGKEHLLCAHNGKEFDFPFLARRMLINGLKLPKALDIAGKKPWEVQHLDTMELWKFGDYKNYTSLNLLAHVFDIPTPKDDIQGSDVGRVYWEEKDLDRIEVYCRKDVIALTQLFLRFRGEPLIKEEEVEIV